MESKSAESLNNSLPAKVDDPLTTIFKQAMAELIKTKSKANNIQSARVERILEISTDEQIKIIEKILLLSNSWFNGSVHRIIWNGLGNYEFISIYCNI